MASSLVAGIRVRAPSEADLAAVAGLIAQLGYPPTVAQMRARLQDLAASAADHVFVADVDGAVAGLATLHVARLPQMEQPRAELTALVTDAGFRRRGVARKLLEAVEDAARGEGCDLLFLRTNQQRDDSHAFYRDNGFQETHLTFNKELTRGVRRDNANG